MSVWRSCGLGGGKSDALLAEALRQVHISNYRGLILRRTFPQLEALIARSMEIYPLVFPKAKYNSSQHAWRFPSGAVIFFGSMQHENDKTKYQGKPYDFIGFDELTHFSNDQYTYLMSRNRPIGPGTRIYIRATANPGGVGHCVPYGEVLTPEGWRDIWTLKTGDEIYSVTPGREMKIECIEQLHRSMEHVYEVNVRGLHMSLTAEHRVMLENGNLRSFAQLPGQANIARTVSWQGAEIGETDISGSKRKRRDRAQSISGEHYAALMGWYVSEGCLVDRDYLVSIAQTKPEGRAKIKALLEEAGLVYTETDTAIQLYGHGLWKHIKDLGLGKCRDKYIPERIKNGTERELRAFFEAAMAGDGHYISKDSGQYYTTSHKLADDMQEVAVKLGYITMQSHRKRTDREGLSYCVSFKRTRNGCTELLTGNHIYAVNTNTKRRSDIVRKGMQDVCCIGLPENHAFILRQKGTVWISGNSWVKSRFIDPAPPMTPIISEYEVNMPDGSKKKLVRDRIFVDSKVFDNKALLNNDPNYLASLAMLPEAQREALLYGNWNSFEGQVFREWKDDPVHYHDGLWTHVIEPFDIPKHWNIYRGFDFGYRRPYAVGWFAADERGKLYQIRENYGCNGEPNHGVEIEPTDIARIIHEIETTDPILKGRQIRGIADPSIFDQSRGPSIADMMSAHPNYVTWEPADNTRLAGLQQCHYRLSFDENGEPMFQTFNTCKHFIRTIPGLVYDEHHVEDVDTSMEDHIYDMWRYICQAYPISPPAPRPLEIPKLNPLETGQRVHVFR